MYYDNDNNKTVGDNTNKTNTDNTNNTNNTN